MAGGNRDLKIKDMEVVMTAKNKAVADDVLGQIARRQNDLFRRVREGSLNPDVILAGLQKMTEGQSDRLEIERIGWNVSSLIHKISVTECRDFLSFLKERGLIWNGIGSSWDDKSSFTLKGVGGAKKIRSFRLAQVEEETVVGLIGVYADMEGYGLATPWELVSFIEQGPMARIISQSEIVALGYYGEVCWADTGKKDPVFVIAKGKPQERPWVFTSEVLHSSGKMPSSIRPSQYILLRDLHR